MGLSHITGIPHYKSQVSLCGDEVKTLNQCTIFCMITINWCYLGWCPHISQYVGSYGEISDGKTKGSEMLGVEIYIISNDLLHFLHEAEYENSCHWIIILCKL